MQDPRNWDLCCLQAVLNCAPRRLSGPEVSAFLSLPDSPPSRRNPELGKRVLALRLWRLLPAARQVGSCRDYMGLPKINSPFVEVLKS